MSNSTAKVLFSQALSHVESKSIRAWAQGPKNGKVFLRLAQDRVKQGRTCPIEFGTKIVALAMGL